MSVANSTTAPTGQAKPVLYLHIGHYKTGSSAIQKYLATHSEALKSDGYVYIASARHGRDGTNHAQLALSIAETHGFIPPAWYTDRVSVDEAFRAFHHEALDHPGYKYVVSSEEFIQLALRDDPQRALTDLQARLSDYDVRVVLYVREPLSLLKSWYNEVNKGKRGTRNFPTFFMNLGWLFLAQERIWQVYAEAFGPDKIMARPYKLKGNAHVEDFLFSIGTSHRPSQQVEFVQEAQPLEELELTRLQKRDGEDFDDVTVTKAANARRIIEKARKISEAYDRLARRVEGAEPSRLTAVAVIEHYLELLKPLQQTDLLNPKEARVLRDLSQGVKRRDSALAGALARTAEFVGSGQPRLAGNDPDARLKSAN